MVKPRTFGPFTDVRDPAHAEAYSDLLVIDASTTDDDPGYVNDLFVVEQAQDGSWECPLSSVPFQHRKRQTTCSKYFGSPELIMKHIGRHILAEHHQLGGEV